MVGGESEGGEIKSTFGAIGSESVFGVFGDGILGKLSSPGANEACQFGRRQGGFRGNEEGFED